MGLMSYLRSIGRGSKCKTEESNDRLFTRAATINKRREQNEQDTLPLSKDVLDHIVELKKIDYLLRFKDAIKQRGDPPAKDEELIGMISASCGCGEKPSADAAAGKAAAGEAAAAGEGAVCPDINADAINQPIFDDNKGTLTEDLKSMLSKSVVKEGLTDSNTLYYGMVEDILRDLKQTSGFDLNVFLETDLSDVKDPEIKRALRDIAEPPSGGGRRARRVRRTKRTKGKSRGRAGKATRVRRNNNNNSNNNAKTKRNKGKKRRTKRA